MVTIVPRQLSDWSIKGWESYMVEIYWGKLENKDTYRRSSLRYVKNRMLKIAP